MRKLLLCAAPLALAACGSEPAPEPAPAETVSAEPAAPASANGSPTGTYAATAADGTVTLTTLNDDWTYTDTTQDGDVLAEGTWAVTDGKTCFTPTGEGSETTCYTETEPQFDGSFTATPDGGEPVMVAKVETAPEEAAAE